MSFVWFAFAVLPRQGLMRRGPGSFGQANSIGPRLVF